jgi:hypothetical protein
MTTFSEISLDEMFPDSDGKPIADNTEQFNRPDGEKFLSPVELSQRLDQERSRADIFAAKLRELGINPEEMA